MAPEQPAGVVGRGVALFFGAFTLVNLTGQMWRPGFDASIWWVDLRPLPGVAAAMLLWTAGLLLTAHGVRPAASVWRRGATAAALLLLIAVALGNAVTVVSLLARGAVKAAVVVPLSVVVAGLLGWSLLGVLRRGGVCWRFSWRRAGGVAAVLAVCTLTFPVLQMYCFGYTDYRRPADVIVVFGCKAYADGRPSDALADRVRTAVALYHEGIAARLIFSGGPGDGEHHETAVMQRMAMELGVPAEAIVRDEDGLNTRATVVNTAAMCEAAGLRRVIAVSHFYHLPRIKLAYQRAGMEVYTVPAKETYVLTQMPYNIAREVAAVWFYYVRPLVA